MAFTVARARAWRGIFLDCALEFRAVTIPPSEGFADMPSEGARRKWPVGGRIVRRTADLSRPKAS